MEPLARILLGLSALWALVLLSYQAAAAIAGGRASRAVPAGSALKGILYGFTAAMNPARKESASRHPIVFGAGIVLHAAVFASLLTVLLSAAFPRILVAVRAPLAACVALGLIACLGLLARRLGRPEMRFISAPDDYAANLLIVVTLAATLGFHAGLIGAVPYWLLASILLVYLPLGKLRHALFFFLARADLSRRLGRRGVYPPAGKGDSSHVR